jgi:putative N-acetylmannosamine-6-phosphate epimerase
VSYIGLRVRTLGIQRKNMEDTKAMSSAFDVEMEDDLNGDVSDASSSATSHASSSTKRDKAKEKNAKRHVCEMADCGKSFDSKWALIR